MSNFQTSTAYGTQAEVRLLGERLSDEAHFPFDGRV